MEKWVKIVNDRYSCVEHISSSGEVVKLKPSIKVWSICFSHEEPTLDVRDGIEMGECLVTIDGPTMLIYEIKH